MRRRREAHESSPRKRKKVRAATGDGSVLGPAEPDPASTTTLTRESHSANPATTAATVTASPPPAAPNAPNNASPSRAGPLPPTAPEPSPADAVQPYLPTHLAHLATEYRFAVMSIQTAHKMEPKVSTLIRHMSEFCFLDPARRPGVVLLHAKGPAVAKLVSVLEITKREVKKLGHRCWQYNRISGHQVGRKERDGGAPREDARAVARKKWSGAEAANGQQSGGASELDEDAMSISQGNEGARETALARDAARPRLKTVATMMVYMSRVAIPRFEQEFGEQKSD